MKYAVVVSHGGIQLSDYCRDSVNLYCRRFGFDAVFLSQKHVNATGPGGYDYGRFEKYQAYKVLHHYDRIMLLDSDTLITDVAPNVFETVTPNKIGVVREDVLGLAHSRRRKIRHVKAVMGDLSWNQGYFNSGVVVASRQHRDIWKVDRELEETLQSEKLGRYKEQKIVNWRVRKLGFDIQWLDPRWNFLKMFERQMGKERTSAFVIHYAGRANRSKKRNVDARILLSRNLRKTGSDKVQTRIEWMIRAAGRNFGKPALFFGLGQNTGVWTKICDARFLECNVKHYRGCFLDPALQGLNAFLVNYSTRVDKWKDSLANQTLNTLPTEVESKRYGVVVVNSPKGNRPGAPGRVSSLLHARRLVAAHGIVFVNDIDRTLERRVSTELFGQPDDTFSERSSWGCWKIKS